MAFYRIFALKQWKWRLALLSAVAVSLCAIGLAEQTGLRVKTTAAEEAVPLPVIMYHSILPQASRQGTYVISPALLESDLTYLADHGFTTVTVADLLAYVRNGKPLPEKPVMLTWDDGYYNNYLYAYPLLQKHGMKGVISPVVSWSEAFSQPGADADREIYSHLTWAELKEMADSGVMEIQNHTYAMHELKAGVRKGAGRMAGEDVTAYQAALREDVAKAQTLLTEQVGITPTAFTYPFGELCKDAPPVLKELGFSASFTCTAKINAITRDEECLWGLGRYLRPAGQTSGQYFEKIFKNLS